MSTILKALKRLDEQRRADAAPKTLEEQVLGPSGARSVDPDAGRTKSLFVVAGTAAALCLAGGTWFALRGDAPVSAAPAPAPVATQPPVATARRAAQPSDGMPVTGTPIDDALREGLSVPSARVEAAPANALLPRADQPEPAAPGPAETPAPPLPALAAQMPADAAIPRREERAPAARPQPEPTRAPAATPPTATLRATPVREPTPASDPSAGDAPAQRAEQESALDPERPVVWVERTRWHPTPEKRSAWVRAGASGESRELREGDAIGGVVVKEVRPSGVLFVYDGAEFKRGVGER